MRLGLQGDACGLLWMFNIQSRKNSNVRSMCIGGRGQGSGTLNKGGWEVGGNVVFEVAVRRKKNSTICCIGESIKGWKLCAHSPPHHSSLTKNESSNTTK